MTSWDGMWVSCPRKAAKMARQQLQKVSKFEHHVLYKPGFWGILSINIMFRGSYNNLWRRSDGVIFSEVLLLPASWLLLPWSVCGIERSETRKFLHPKLTSFPSKHLPGRVIRIKKHLMLPCQAMERSRHYRKARLLVGKQPGKKSLHSDKGDPEGMFCSWIFMVGTNTYIYIYIYMLIWNRIKCDLEAQGKFPNLGVVLLQVDEHAKGWMFTDGINPLLFDVFN